MCAFRVWVSCCMGGFCYGLYVLCVTVCVDVWGGVILYLCVVSGVYVWILCVGFMSCGWVRVGVYLCCVWGDILALGACSGNLTVRFDNE
jgi:hypothetical protein